MAMMKEVSCDAIFAGNRTEVRVQLYSRWGTEFRLSASIQCNFFLRSYKIGGH